MNKLFTSYTLPNGTVVKNRFFKAAMNEAMGNRYLQPKDEVIDLYALWAKGGAGIVVTGNVMVDANALAEPGNVVFDENSDMEKLKRWAQEGKQNNTQIFVQINHPGKQAPKMVSKQPVAPSAVAIGGALSNFFNTPRELSTLEVKEIVQKFVTAAKIAQDAGFSGVEIHAAHGYLISQFLSPHDNQRTDEYGGNRENRMRFVKEIFLGMRQACGADFPIGIKINSTDFKEGGFSQEDSIFVVQELAKLGIDFVEISGGSYESPRMSQTSDQAEKEVFFADYAKQLKTLVDVPVVVTGGIRSVDAMEQVLEDSIADFIGIARPMAIALDLPNQISNNIYNTIQTKHVSTGIKSLDKKFGSMLGLVHYQLLMQKYAKGKMPKITANAWPAVFHALAKQGIAGILPQRAKKEN